MSILLISDTLVAATPPKYKAGQLKGSLLAEYYITNSNYGKSGGDFEKLPNNNEFLYIMAEPSLLYGLSNDWGLSSGLTYAYGKSDDSGTQRTNSAATDIHADLYYKLYKKNFYLLPRLFISYPLQSFETGQDDVIINDGSLKIEFGAWAEKKLLAHRFYLYAGYAFQGEGLASLIPWEVGAYNTIGRFLYGFSALGHQIASDDDEISNPQVRSNRTDSLNAGSKKFYSVNPTEINLKAWAGARVSKNFIIYVKYKRSINGSNSANGQSFMAEIKWRILNPYSKKSIEEKSGFKIDGIDQNEQKALDNMLDIPN